MVVVWGFCVDGVVGHPPSPLALERRGEIVPPSPLDIKGEGSFASFFIMAIMVQSIPLAPLRFAKGEIPRWARNDVVKVRG